MKKVIAVAAVIGLAVGLTWAAEQAGNWLGFAQQDTPGNEPPPGSEGVPPSGKTGRLPSREGVAPSDETLADAQSQGEEASSQPELSAEVTSIEEDLARIEEALGSEEVLEEFTPSEPLSADNPVVWPTDI